MPAQYLSLVICSPPCRNNGRCVAPNRCDCTDEWEEATVREVYPGKTKTPLFTVYCFYNSIQLFAHHLAKMEVIVYLPDSVAALESLQAVGVREVSNV